MILGGLEYRYDRRVDRDFLRLFDAQGFFRTLTEYAQKARYPVDLQFRRNPKTGAQHASLYVGLTTVLDVYWRSGSVKLAAHPSFHGSGFHRSWTSWATLAEASRWVAAIESYLDAVIPKASAGRAAVEGAVQAAISSFDSEDHVMLDREVLLHFCDTSTKNRVMESVSADLLHALRSATVPGTPPASFGGKCDILAIDSNGQVLAIEVKPKGVPTIVWAPAQAIVYARLLRRWTRHDPEAIEILSGMLSQRTDLRLARDSMPALPPQPEVVPVVAVQRGMSVEHRRRLVAVRDHLADHGIEDATKLKVYEVTLAGRLLARAGNS